MMIYDRQDRSELYDATRFLGFTEIGDGLYCKDLNELSIYLELIEHSHPAYIELIAYKMNRSILDQEFKYDEIPKLILTIDNWLISNDQSVISCINIYDKVLRLDIIQAAKTTRDLAKNLVRVKSSNVWSRGINVKDNKSSVGDVIVQFKGSKGGPGDIYMYYDVPISVYRRWISAPSVGHYFWVNIRNRYRYRKLTGDKRGKLPNAVN